MILLMLLLMADDAALRQRVFGEVKKAVETGYYDQKLGNLDWGSGPGMDLSEADFYEAINTKLGMLKDGHTSVVTPTAVKNRKAATRFGLGFDARFLEGKLTIIGVRAGSPLEAAGAKRGWVVKSVNRSMVPGTEKEFGTWIVDLGVGRLCEADQVEIELLTELDEARTFAGGCATLQVEHVKKVAKVGNSVVIRFDQFDAETADWFDRVLNENLGAPGIVLDLRTNSGGLRSSLLKIASRLFDKKLLLGRSLARRGHVTEWKAGGEKPYTGKLTVLVDAGTQSAAEILAGALQEGGRARVFGRKTAGSVLLMLRRKLADGGELRLSVEDFVLASGKRLEGVGVKPDVELALGIAQIRFGYDADVIAAAR